MCLCLTLSNPYVIFVHEHCIGYLRKTLIIYSCPNRQTNINNNKIGYLTNDVLKLLPTIHLNPLDFPYLQIIQPKSQVVQDYATMAASERHSATKKTNVRQRGSKRYFHLLNFIETRRKKKLENRRKRSTLDPSAKVILLIKILLLLLLLILVMMTMMMVREKVGIATIVMMIMMTVMVMVVVSVNNILSVSAHRCFPHLCGRVA